MYQFIVPCLFHVASWDRASALFVVTPKYQNPVMRPPQSLLFSEWKDPTLSVFPHRAGSPTLGSFSWPSFGISHLSSSFLNCGDQNWTQSCRHSPTSARSEMLTGLQAGHSTPLLWPRQPPQRGVTCSKYNVWGLARSCWMLNEDVPHRQALLGEKPSTSLVHQDWCLHPAGQVLGVSKCPSSSWNVMIYTKLRNLLSNWKWLLKVVEELQHRRSFCNWGLSKQRRPGVSVMNRRGQRVLTNV